ncbi:MAG: DNA alkylation repair protein [Ruminococcus sp.]|nr:DNA alkylation repair protein [Ruminococcus sp.]
MNDICTEIRQRLLSMEDKPYKEFHSKLINTVPPERIIGIRVPEKKKLASEYAKREDISAFLADLPHYYYEEYDLHAFIVMKIKDFGRALAETERLLPYIDNWATCDSFCPPVFSKHRQELLPSISKWLASEHTYTVRFGIGMLMKLYLDDDFKPEYPEAVAAIKSEEYYIRMMQAWYFATALSKQYESILPYLTENRLDKWVHNKTIQKAVESFRITDEQKAYLKTLRIK